MSKPKEKDRLIARIQKLQQIQRNLKIELKLIRYAKTVSGKEMREMVKVTLELAKTFETQVECDLALLVSTESS